MPARGAARVRVERQARDRIPESVPRQAPSGRALTARAREARSRWEPAAREPCSVAPAPAPEQWGPAASRERVPALLPPPLTAAQPALLPRAEPRRNGL